MQKELIIQLAREGHGYDEIQKELQNQFGQYAYKQNAIYKYMRQVKLGCFEAEVSSFNGERIDEQLLTRILQVIEENPFFSVRSIAMRLNVTPSIIHRYLTQELNYVYTHSRWVPHSLNSSQKKKAGRIDGAF